jgi:hypothetical protein
MKPSRLLALLVVVTVSAAAAAAAAAAAPAVAAPVAGQELLRRVQTVYGQNRKAIRSVEYDYTFDLNGNIRKARYARDGGRYYQGSVWVLDGGFGMAAECAWDGQRVHDRTTMGRLNRSTDRKRFSFYAPVPENRVDLFVTWALGFEAELLPNFSVKPNQKFRFLGGRTVEDEEHGTCIELEFTREWERGTMLTRHARRYAYAPVYWRTVEQNGDLETEMKDVRYATVQSDGNELHFPVRLTMLSYNPGGQVGNTSNFRVDEPTLKLNQPIARSRFVLEPWPNEDVYDWGSGKLTEGKDPRWSPVGNVDFPWDGFVAAAARNDARHKPRPAVAAPGGGPTAPDPARPWAEALGGWVAIGGLAVALVAAYVIFRQRHPRMPARRVA